MEINLTQERKTLEERIKVIESRIAPIQKELKELRERLVHIKALMPEEQTKFVSPLEDDTPKGFWSKAAKELGLVVGNDSAHRVVIRKAPEFHRFVPHQCNYDGKTYPI